MGKDVEVSKSRQEETPTKWKWIMSGVIWYSTFSLGLGFGFIGSTLVELSMKFQTDIPTLSKVFTIVTFAFLLSATLCGVAFNYVNRQIAVGILLIIMGSGTIFLPLVSSVPLFFVSAAISGIGAAGYDTAQIVWIIEMWASHAAPYIQMQHFCFALGTFVSPLLVKPFLMSPAQLNATYLTNTTLDTIPDGIQDPTDEPIKSLLFIPFLIGGLVAIIGGITFLILYCIKKYEKPPQRETTEQCMDFQDPGKVKGCNLHKIVLVSLSAIFIGAYCGMEVCTFQFLPTFTHFIDLKLTPAEGALILSGLAAAYTATRAVGIFVVLKIRPEILLLGNFILTLSGNTLLLFFANSSIEILWAGAITLGLGFSTVFPAFYGFIEKHLKVSNVVGAAMIVAGAVVSSLYPIVIGSFIEENALVLMYTNYFSLILCISAFLAIYCITRKRK